MDIQSLRDFHDAYIKGVRPGMNVLPEVYLVAYLTNEVLEIIPAQSTRIHIRSIALKHIYEKRNAYDYDIILDNLVEIIRFPDSVHHNNDVKQADYIFVKEIDKVLYACAIKVDAHPEAGQEISVVVSAFKTTINYIKKFELIRSWKGGIPSS